MVNIEKFANGKNYLKATMIDNEKDNVYIITKEPKLIKKTINNQTRETIESIGEFNGEGVIFDINQTNAKKLSNVLGSETADWVGKIIHLRLEVITIDDEPKNSIKVGIIKTDAQ